MAIFKPRESTARPRSYTKFNTIIDIFHNAAFNKLIV